MPQQLPVYEDAEHHYAPYIDVEVEFDSLQTDPLLQQSLLYKDDDDDNNNKNNNTENSCNHNDRHHDTGYIGFHDDKLSSMSLNALGHKRKLSSIADSSDATSDSSGRFDDANEVDDDDEQIMAGWYTQTTATTAATTTANSTDAKNGGNGNTDDAQETRSVHSAKRGRSNGWPLQNEIAYDEHGMRIDLSSRRTPPPPPPAKSTHSPRSRRAGGSPRDSDRERDRDRHRASSPVLRARRSRFVEGSMHDRVSEKPPSIFIREDGSQVQGMPEEKDGGGRGQKGQSQNVEKRSSGIFRFGKAIASAFHPFSGGWGNKSEVWKGSQDGPKTQKELMKQRQARAEKAYAELKKSGYQGTTISGTTSTTTNAVDANIADQTWKAIQEKMDYKVVAGEGRISQDDTLVAVPEAPPPLTPSRNDKGISKLKSFSELRKRTSTLSIPSMRARDVSPLNLPLPEREPEITPAHRPVERRQSRKELNRQAKLLKRVSNLEDKLERARRELRELSSLEQPPPPLPTICVDDVHDSEKQQQQQQHAFGTLPTVPSGRLLDMSTDAVDRLSEHEAGQNLHFVSPQPTAAKWPPVDSLSRKRKPKAAADHITISSADHITISSADHITRSSADGFEDYDADCGKDKSCETPKKTKSSKLEKKNRPDAPIEQSENSKRPTKSKTTRDKRASSLTTKASQRLKAKQSSRNLRQVASTNDDNGNPNTTTATAAATATATGEIEKTVYLQEQEGNNASRASSIPTSRSASPSSKDWWRYSGDENIPPVPPVPKELLVGKKTAFVDNNITSSSTTTKESGQSKRRAPSREFAWPEDIF